MNLPQTATVQVQHCRSCRAEILWLKHGKTGKPAPIDAKPVPTGGNIRVDLAAGTYEIVPKAARTGPLRTNHFTTCPQTARWHKQVRGDNEGSEAAG